MSSDADRYLVLGTGSVELRRGLGPTAWVVFEELLLASTDTADGYRAPKSSRRSRPSWLSSTPARDATPTPKERGALGRQTAEDTRGHKSGHDVTDLRSRWLAEAAAVGVTPESLRDSIEQAALARPPQRQRVVIEDVANTVAERRSAWHRSGVLQTICDMTRPHSGVNGDVWAAVLDRAVDVVLGQCVDLDPSETHTRRRVSDGRSVWIEPSARHHTSDRGARAEGARVVVGD